MRNKYTAELFTVMATMAAEGYSTGPFSGDQGHIRTITPPPKKEVKRNDFIVINAIVTEIYNLTGNFNEELFKL